ncbi:hypothetical protein LTR85_012147 [Meristemomyces frigidus]|nr:hypothetical protein LTR85_012147 [Meristemomyces frigidus]
MRHTKSALASSAASSPALSNRRATVSSALSDVPTTKAEDEDEGDATQSTQASRQHVNEEEDDSEDREANEGVDSDSGHHADEEDDYSTGRGGDEEVAIEPKQRVDEEDDDGSDEDALDKTTQHVDEDVDDGSDEDILDQLLAKSTQRVDQEIDDSGDEEAKEGVIAASKIHIHKGDPSSSVQRVAIPDPLKITKISGVSRTIEEKLNSRHGSYVCDYMEKLHQGAANVVAPTRERFEPNG